MKIVIVKNSKIARLLKVDGIVVYPFIFFAGHEPDIALISHEMIHIDQIKTHGVPGFYFLYLKEYLQNRIIGMDHNSAYLAISFEKEAYEKQHKIS